MIPLRGAKQAKAARERERERGREEEAHDHVKTEMDLSPFTSGTLQRRVYIYTHSPRYDDGNIHGGRARRNGRGPSRFRPFFKWPFLVPWMSSPSPFSILLASLRAFQISPAAVVVVVIIGTCASIN